MGNYLTYVIRMPSSSEQKTAITQSISEVVEAQEGEIVGMALEHGILLNEVLKSRLGVQGVEDVYREVAAMVEGRKNVRL